ncbi:MAG: hypothetical protein K1X39_14460 [Thermoflexales bacterium]|nr:hypothetical protein [Thermoflexales bacterium]
MSSAFARLVRLALVVCIAALPPMAAAEAPPANQGTLSLVVEAGFGGYARHGAWFPVRVSVTNEGPALDGVVTLSDATANATPQIESAATLPVGRRVFAMAAIRAGRGLSVTVRGGGQRADALASLRWLATEDRLVVVVADPLDAYNFLADIRTPYGGRTVVVTQRIEQLPARTAEWDAVDALIFSQVDSAALSTDQRSAIEAWVIAGGQLILAGGGGLAMTAGGFPATLPARPGGPLTRQSIADLATWTASRSFSTTQALSLTAPVERLTVVQGAVGLVGPATLPLIARRGLGVGVIDALAFDPSLAPVRDWPDRAAMFAALFDGRVDALAAVRHLRSVPTVPVIAGEFTANRLPPTAGLVLFFLVYPLVGLLLFAVAFRRPARWRMTPRFAVALSLSFTVMALAIAWSLSRDGPWLHRAEITLGHAGVSAVRSNEIAAIKVVQRTTVEVDFGTGLAAAPADLVPQAAYQPELDGVLEMPTLRMGDAQRSVARNASDAAWPLFAVQGTAVSAWPLAEAVWNGWQDGPSLAITLTNPQRPANHVDCAVVGPQQAVTLSDVGVGTVTATLVLPPDASPVRAYAFGAVPDSSFGTYRRAATNRGRSEFAPFGAQPLSFLSVVPYSSSNSYMPDMWYSNYARPVGGVSLACLNDRAALDVRTTSPSVSTVVDASLGVWRVDVPAPPTRVGQTLAPVLWEGTLVASQGSASWGTSGLTLSVGRYLFVFRPWTPVRLDGRALAGGAKVTTRPAAVGERPRVQLQLYDWAAQRFIPTSVATGTLRATDGTQTWQLSDVHADIASNAGEVVVAVDVAGGQVVATGLTLANLTVTYPGERP